MKINVSPGCIYYYNEANQLHREDGPAIEYSDGAKEWRRDGLVHREDGPAVIYSNGLKSYFIKNRRVDRARIYY